MATALVIGVALGAVANRPAAAAEAVGAPQLLGSGGYLIKVRDRTAGGVVTHRIARVTSSGRRTAVVDVLAQLDPSYRPRRTDYIELVVRCGETLWIGRRTDQEIRRGSFEASRSVTRLYWLTARGQGQARGEQMEAAFDANRLVCAADDSVYVSGSSWPTDTPLPRPALVRVTRATEQPIAKSDAVPIAVKTGVAYRSGRRGETTIVGYDGTTRKVRPKNTTKLSPSGLASDGRSLHVYDDAGYVRRFEQRKRGFYFAPPISAFVSTTCGGIIMTRNISVDRGETAFLRNGRVVRRIGSTAFAHALDLRAGTVALGGRVYRGCGSHAGSLIATLPPQALGSGLIGSTDEHI